MRAIIPGFLHFYVTAVRVIQICVGVAMNVGVRVGGRVVGGRVAGGRVRVEVEGQIFFFFFFKVSCLEKQTTYNICKQNTQLCCSTPWLISIRSRCPLTLFFLLIFSVRASSAPLKTFILLRRSALSNIIGSRTLYNVHTSYRALPSAPIESYCIGSF